MRILCLSNCPLQVHLGSGYVIATSIEGLRAAGHAVVVLEPANYEWLPRLRAGKRLRMLCGYTAATLRALRRGTFDLVEFWGGEASWVARRIARRRRRPILVARSNGLEPHADAEQKRQGVSLRLSPAGRSLDRWLDPAAGFRAVDALITVSAFDEAYARAQSYQPAHRLRTISPGLSSEWLGQPLVPERPPTVGFFGSWLPNKGCELLVAALVCPLRQQRNWNVRFTGIGAVDVAQLFPPDLRPRVESVPFVRDRVRLRELYRRTAIVAMPSAYESFGLVAVEAMACGCALVSSVTGFAAGLAPQVDASLVSERTERAWSEALAAMMVNDNERRRIAAGGHSRVQELSIPAARERLLSFYQGLAPAPAVCGS